MRRLALLLLPALAMAAAPALCLAAAGESRHMQAFKADLSDRQSLQRGARTFVNYCLGCHSAAYMRYNRIAADLGIEEATLKQNLMFATDKPGETMTIAMQKREAEIYFGVAPPDLSVTARARGADWLYSYFLSFYRDPKRPTGVNNLIFKDTAMPHVLWELQGWQRPVYDERADGDGGVTRAVAYLETETPLPNKPAAYADEDYARTVADLVNFMVYLGEPARLKRHAIGAWTMLYLSLLLAIVYLLKREYWKDIPSSETSET